MEEPKQLERHNNDKVSGIEPGVSPSEWVVHPDWITRSVTSMSCFKCSCAWCSRLNWYLCCCCCTCWWCNISRQINIVPCTRTRLLYLCAVRIWRHVSMWPEAVDDQDSLTGTIECRFADRTPCAVYYCISFHRIFSKYFMCCNCTLLRRIFLKYFN